MSCKKAHEVHLARLAQVLEGISQGTEALRCCFAESKSVKAWLVREWAGLGSVADAIQRGWLNMPDKTPNKKLVLGLAKEIATGMAYLHNLDIVYGGLDSSRHALATARSPNAVAMLHAAFSSYFTMAMVPRYLMFQPGA